jgi:hypothetical protein
MNPSSALTKFVDGRSRIEPDEVLRFISEQMHQTGHFSEEDVCTLLLRVRPSARAETLHKISRDSQINFTEQVLFPLIHGVGFDRAESRVATFCEELNIQITEKTIFRLAMKDGGSGKFIEFLQTYIQQHGSPSLTTATLNALVGCQEEINRPLELLRSLSGALDIQPDLGTYQLLFYKVMSTPVMTDAARQESRALFLRIQSLSSAEEYIDESAPLRFRILYARYFFIERQPTKAIVILSSILKAKKASFNLKRVTFSLIATFLPEDHPFRLAMQESLLQQGLYAIVDEGRNAGNNFIAIFREWEKAEEHELNAKFGGGDIFDNALRYPVDRLARRVTSRGPKN